MKTIQELNELIAVEVAEIEALNRESLKKPDEGASREAWAKRQREIKKQIGKHKDEIKHLRKLILFVERVSEEGVIFMLDRLRKEVKAIVDGANATYTDDNACKHYIRKYKDNAGMPLKMKQIKELEFLLK